MEQQPVQGTGNYSAVSEEKDAKEHVQTGSSTELSTQENAQLWDPEAKCPSLGIGSVVEGWDRHVVE